ncbi:MAG TPA: acetate--CoA ligase family protein [Burkholderiales bacterium]|nr:acetate--CoA ligase family protein [Burkholderiales bacterium]
MTPQDIITEARRQGRNALDEASGKALLAHFDIAVPKTVVVSGPAEVNYAVRTLTPPFVVKVVSADILHKSDAGGVSVGLKSAAEISAAIRAMLALPKISGARVEGWLIEEMAPAGHELVVGGLRDPQFGPLLMLGLGGVFVEILRDVAFRICPIRRLDAEQMIDELKGAAILEGARGRAPASRQAIVDVLMKVGGEDGLLMRHGNDIAELDVNPLIVSEQGAVAVDARFILQGQPHPILPPSRGRAGSPSPSTGEGGDGGESIVEQFTPLFAPKTVAVVGASTKGTALPNVFIRRIREFGYAGAIYPIHPSAPQIDGLPAHKSLADTPQPIDYAYIAIAAAQIPPLLEGARGRLKFAQVISSGFGEVEEGRALQSQLAAAARAGGARLIGPNCLGVYTPRGKVTFAEIGSKDVGGVGVISQSGGLGTDIIRRGFARGLHFSGLVTVGNCADVTPSELLEFYFADDTTRVIGMYIETAQDGRRLFEILREHGSRKPVVVLKGGRTRQGLAAAASHTGSLAGDDRVWVALSRQTGCILVDTLDQFIDTLLLFQALRPRPAHPTQRVALFGNGGGTSVLATDYFARLGLDVTPFDQATIDALAALKLPPGTSITNPVDCPVGTLQQEEGRVAEKILDLIYGSGKPDALVMHLNLSAFVGRTKPEVLDNLVKAALRVQEHYPGQAHFILVLRSDGDPPLEKRKREFRERAVALGVPVYDEMSNAGHALAALREYELFLNRSSSPRATGRG